MKILILSYSYPFKTFIISMSSFNLIFIFGNWTSYLQCVVFQINLLFQIGLNRERQGTELLNRLRMSHFPDCCYLFHHRYSLSSSAWTLFCLADAPDVHMEHNSLSVVDLENHLSRLLYGYFGTIWWKWQLLYLNISHQS